MPLLEERIVKIICTKEGCGISVATIKGGDYKISLSDKFPPYCGTHCEHS